MVSLRFPFSYPHQPPKQPHILNGSRPFPFYAASAAAGVGIGLGLSIYLKSAKNSDPCAQNPRSFASPMWATLSLAEGGSKDSVEPKTGVSFPSVLDGSRRLLGVGVRRKSVLGLKNIDVYAFGNDPISPFSLNFLQMCGKLEDNFPPKFNILI